MKETRQDTRGIGYLATVFSAVDLATMAEALKQFAFEKEITEQSEEGEVLNQFVSILIKTLDLDSFQAVAPQLFSYPTTYQGVLEVEEVKATEEELNYLKDNIDALLQEMVHRASQKSHYGTIRERSKLNGKY